MKKCEVLYIHSSKKMELSSSMKYNIMPMGIIGILNNLKSNGIDVLGYNYAIEKHLDPDFDLSSLLAETDYKILMTDLHWYEHSYGAIYITELSKRIKPNIPTIIGGYTSTIFADEIMQNFNSVDYIVTGDSDLPSEMLVKHLLYRTKTTLSSIPNILFREGTVIKSSSQKWVQSTLDTIDYINTDFFEHEELIPFLTPRGVDRNQSGRWICIARGCKFNCSYCCGANKNMQTLFNRCNILLRSPHKVAEDFYKLNEKNIWSISPSHDFEMFGKNYYQELFSEIQKRNIKPGLYLECFQLPTKYFIDGIAETFDREKTILAISPISGNEELRHQNGKIFNNNNFYDTVSYILSKRIKLQIYYTINPFGETRAQYEDTVFQMSYLHTLFNLNKQNILYQQIVLDPLAGMRKYDGINATFNTFMDYYNYCILPESKHKITGFDDKCEVSVQEKKDMYASIFN